MTVSTFTPEKIKEHRTAYERNVQDRSFIHYIVGLAVRWKQQWKYVYARHIERRHGATIGKEVVMPISLAKKANRNLIIGDHVSLQTDKIDLRSPVKIGSHVIIGHNTETRWRN